jgi:hypothetical protein
MIVVGYSTARAVFPTYLHSALDEHPQAKFRGRASYKSGLQAPVFRLANCHQLSGRVRNTPSGVTVEAQGDVGSVQQLVHT